MINDICDRLVPLEPEFTVDLEVVKQVIEEVEFFAAEGCGCDFPINDMYQLRESADGFSATDLKPIGFTVASNTMISTFCKRKTSDPNCVVHFPDFKFDFLGNRTLCLDSEQMRDLAVQPADSTANWNQLQELWFDSGLLATFLVKIAMTNFALGLARLADPFV